MRTLETTSKKVNGLKSYSVCAHNLKAAKYLLSLASKPSENLCAAVRAYKFDDLEDAKRCGDAFLESTFNGIFAHKQFMKQWKLSPSK
jgi:hypothetical protein